MAENTEISWTDHTFNPWEGCQKVGPGCDNCYAEARNARFSGGTAINWGPGAPRRRTSVSNWNKPLRWEALSADFEAVHARRQRVFCSSLADVFDNEVDAQWRRQLFVLIANTPTLDWLLLTKRIGNAKPMMRDAGVAKPLPNVWLGATIVNQEEADRDIPKLLATPAAVRFLSMEPLLGPVTFAGRWVPHPNPAMHENWLEALDWVIVGGESGPGARPMHPDWACSLRDQCAAAGVPFHFKQWGEWRPICEGGSDWYNSLYKSKRLAAEGEDQSVLDDVWGRKCTVPTACIHHDGSATDPSAPGSWQQGTGAMQAFKVGKKAAGRLLDGVLHDGFPENSTRGTAQ